VNDDIVTRTDLQVAEQDAIEEIYSRNAGEALDRQIAKARTELLRDLITRKLLVQQAETLFDIAKMQDSFIRQFRESQKIATNTELERVLKEEGFTFDEFKKKLIEINAPGSVIEMEVRGKIAVSDAEIEAYYRGHQKELATPDKVSYREILLKVGARTMGETIVLARKLAERAKSPGADFTALAGDESEVDAALRGVVLGPFTKGELAAPLEEAAFALGPGDISEPVVVGDTVHLLRVETREVSQVPPLDSLREKIAGDLERENYAAALEAYLKGLWQRAEVCVADEYMSRLPEEFRKYVKC